MQVTKNDTRIYKCVVYKPTACRNYSGEQKVNFESPVLFSKCLRAKVYSNINVYFDPQGC